MIRSICILLCVFLASFSCTSESSIKIDPEEIDGLVVKLKDSLKIPGVAVGIAIGDDIKYTRFTGTGNLSKDSELSDSSLWPLCSISKQFATAACLKLSEEGKLSLDEKISGYINGLPESYENIRISNLLNQTSGIKDYINEKKLYGASWEDIKRSIFSDTLNFVPGSSWSYSNTGFCLAAGIVEKITGTDYYDYIKDNIFKKLKMEKTVPVSDIQDNGVMVKGYEYENGKYVAPYLDISENNGKGDGEYVSTLNDLLKWSIGLTGGKILKEKSLHEMWSRATLNNGDTIEVFPNSGMNYGMGWFVRKIGNVDVVWTPGSGFGFSTTLQYVPKYNLTVIVFCNREKFLMADEIGEAVIRKIIKTDRFD